MSDDPAAASRAYVLDLLAGRSRAQALSTAAALGVADRLGAGPRSVDELAREIGCDALALRRLLGVLAGLGLCERVDEQRFALTSQGEALRQDALGPLAAFLGTPLMWDPWSRLREAVAEGGANAFERTHGADLYTLLARSPEAARAYDLAIDAFSRAETAALCERFAFSEFTTVVDVGGGRGTCLAGLLTRWPHLRGVLLDLPHVVQRTGPRLEQQHPGRVEVVAGDFLERLPGGADVYLLKHVLHNWDDGQATALLRRCGDALADGGCVLVIEGILAPGRADAAGMLDLEMLVLTAGRERRKPELRRLFQGAGLQLERSLPLTPASWLLVGTRRD